MVLTPQQQALALGQLIGARKFWILRRRDRWAIHAMWTPSRARQSTHFHITRFDQNEAVLFLIRRKFWVMKIDKFKDRIDPND
jgi:hypothetical protein